MCSQISQEQEGEERRMREEKERALRELRKQLQDQQVCHSATQFLAMPWPLVSWAENCN